MSRREQLAARFEALQILDSDDVSIADDLADIAVEVLSAVPSDADIDAAWKRWESQNRVTFTDPDWGEVEDAFRAGVAAALAHQETDAK